MADRSVVVRYAADTSAYVAGMAKMASSTKSFGATAAASASKHTREWEQMSSKVGAAGIALGLGVGVAVKRFADFDEAMSGVKAATRATGGELDSLRTAAIAAGAATKYSAQGAAEGITELSKAGVETADILQGGLTGALNLAAAGQLDVARAAEVGAVTMKQFNLAGSQMNHVADLLAAGAGKATGSVDDMANALKYAGVPAHSLGISIEETTGTLALFASKGIIGEQAGTSFRGMLLSLAAPTKAAQKTMDELGISLYDGTGHFVGMQGAAEQLHAKLGPLSEATRNAALGQMFGNEQITAAIALYEAGGKGVADWTKSVNDSGFAARQAATLTDNLRGDVERLGGAFDSVFVKSGSSVNGMLRGLVQTTTGLVDAVGNIPGPVLIAGAALTSFALVGPKVVIAYRGVMSNLDHVGLSLDKIAAKSPRAAAGMRSVGAAGAALAGLAVAGSAMQTVWDQAAGAGDDATAALERYIAAGKNAEDVPFVLSHGFEHLQSSVAWAMDPGAWKTIREGFAEIGTGFGLYGGTQQDEAQSFFDTLDKGLTGLVQNGKAKEAAKLFQQVASAAKDQGKTLDQVKGVLPQYSAAIDATGASSSEAAQATAQLTEAWVGSRNGLDQATTSAQNYADALRAINQPTLDLRETENQLAESYAAARDQLDKKTGSMSANSEAGRENRRALDAVAEAELAHIAAIQDAGASEGAMQQQLATSRDRLMDVATAFYGSKQKAREYIDTVLDVPAKATTTVYANTEQAQSKITSVSAALVRLNNKSATTYVRTIYTTQGHMGASLWGGQTKADGGLVVAYGSRFADGGVRIGSGVSVARQPMLAVGGGPIMWNEPETGFEAYISGKPAARARNQAVLRQVAPKVGMKVVPAADGRYASQSAYDAAVSHGVAVDSGSIGQAMRSAISGMRVDLDGDLVGRVSDDRARTRRAHP